MGRELGGGIPEEIGLEVVLEAFLEILLEVVLKVVLEIVLYKYTDIPILPILYANSIALS